MINRRTIMKMTAAVPMAAALPACLSPAVGEIVASAQAVAGFPWVWRLSTDGGYEYTEEFATKDEALAALREWGVGGTIAECKSQEFELYVGHDDLREVMEGHNSDIIGEGEFVEWTDEQGKELETAVNAVIRAWARKHNINNQAWVFAGVRNKIQGVDLVSASDNPA